MWNTLWENMKMNFKQIDLFSKEFKRFFKKYNSLDGDLLEFKKVLKTYPEGIGKHFTTLQCKKNIRIIKGRLSCRYLQSSSLRIIYSYDNQNNSIDFIELYSKSEKSREDQERIKNYLKNI